MVQAALTMCDRNQKFLFEVIPDFLPHNRLTNVELALWNKYHERKQQEK